VSKSNKDNAHPFNFENVVFDVPRSETPPGFKRVETGTEGAEQGSSEKCSENTPSLSTDVPSGGCGGDNDEELCLKNTGEFCDEGRGSNDGASDKHTTDEHDSDNDANEPMEVSYQSPRDGTNSMSDSD
jgi:hypothetical protein